MIGRVVFPDQPDDIGGVINSHIAHN